MLELVTSRTFLYIIFWYSSVLRLILFKIIDSIDATVSGEREILLHLPNEIGCYNFENFSYGDTTVGITAYYPDQTYYEQIHLLPGIFISHLNISKKYSY